MEYKNNKNPAEPSFLGFIAFFLIFISSFISLISKNANSILLQTTQKLSLSSTQPVANKQKINLLKISDIQMEIPQNWKIISVSKNSAKILTDYKKYQVYLNLNLEKNSAVADSYYKSKFNNIKTKYGEVFEVSCGGPTGCTGALMNGNRYSFAWNTESNQPSPENPDGIWVPESNVTSEILFNITKTVKPLN